MLENALLRQKDDLTNQFRLMLETATSKLTESWDRKTESFTASSSATNERVGILEEKVRMINFKIITSSATVGTIVGAIVFILDRTLFR